ncbi:hypothetical protein F5X99DRAFT_425986 [Biscogniauxia marginata]|nr:hypothetical protein F5X99DRAFT_425986 [Biscogniauxia marginata]
MDQTTASRIPSIVVPDEEKEEERKARQHHGEGSESRVKPRPVRYPDGLADRLQSRDKDYGHKNDIQTSLDPRSTETRDQGRNLLRDVHPHTSTRSPSPHHRQSAYQRTKGLGEDLRPTRSPSPLSRSVSAYTTRQRSWPIHNPDRSRFSDPGNLLARSTGTPGARTQPRRLRKKSIYIPPTAASSVQGSALPSPDLAAPGFSPIALNNLRGIYHQQYSSGQPFSDLTDMRSCIATVELKPPTNNMKPTPNKRYEHVWEKHRDYLEDAGQTSLMPISSGEYLEEGLRGSAITLNCPDDVQGAAKADDVKTWWLHVNRHSVGISLLEDLLISCPYIHDDAKWVALAFLGHVLPTVEKQSSVGKYIEPGYVMRYDGRHSLSRYKKDTSVTFIAAPYLSFMSGATLGHESKEDHITRTLLQSLYDYDLQDIRASRNSSWRQVFNSDKTIYAPQLWCLMVGTNVVITLGDISVLHITGRLIGVNPYEPGARKTIFIVQPYHDHYSFDVQQGMAFTEFLQLVTRAIQEHHHLETDFDLEDEDGRLLTAKRWLNLLSSTQFSKATFIVVFRKEDDGDGEANSSMNDSLTLEPEGSSEVDTTIGTQIGSPDLTNEETSIGSIGPAERFDMIDSAEENQKGGTNSNNPFKMPPRLNASNLYHSSTSRLRSAQRGPNSRPFFTWIQHSQGSQLNSQSPPTKLLQKLHSSLRNENELYKIGHQCKLRNLHRRHHCLAHMAGETERKSSSTSWKGQESTPSSPDASISADVDDSFPSHSRWSSQFRSRKSLYERPSLGSQKTSNYTAASESTKPAMSTLLSNASKMFVRLTLDKDLVGDVPGVESEVQDLSNHIKAMRLMLRALYEVSTDLLSLFVPLEYDDNIVIRKHLGCLDQIFKHAEFSLAINDTDSSDQWLIRDFMADVSMKTGQTLSKLEDTSFQGCESCRSGKTYEDVETALKHIHSHLEHKDDENRKINYQWLDDPCLVWLVPQHPLSHDRWSRNVKGVIEPLLHSLRQIRSQAEELRLSVSTSKDGHDTLDYIAQELPSSLVQAFEMILLMHLVTAQRVSIAIGGNKRSRHKFLKTIRVPQNTSSTFLARQFKEYTEKATALLSKAQKDLILFSSTTTHPGSVNLKPIGREFLVAAILNTLQNQLLEHGTHLSVLDLYRSKISKLQYLVSARPQRRLFLEIKAVEIELQALRNVFSSQNNMFQKYLLTLDPSSFHVPNSDRDSQYPLECNYIDEQLRVLEAKDLELQFLQSCARDLKSQVKQSIEILEEGHGKAIRVFTIVTLFFLPMSFFTSFMGMNTVDIRDTDRDQRFFWAISIPMTAGVVALAMIYGYKWDSVMDFASTVWEVYQTRREGRHKHAGLEIPGLSDTHSYRDDRGSSTRSLKSTERMPPRLRLAEAVWSFFRRGRASSEADV